MNRRRLLKIVNAKGVLKEAELGFAAGEESYGDDVEPVGGVVKAVPRNIVVSGTDDAATLLKTDGVLRGIGVPAGFHFDEYEDRAVPGDNVDLARRRAIG